MLLQRIFLENLQSDINSALDDGNVHTTQMLCFYKKICNFLYDYTDIGAAEETLFVQCLKSYVKCIGKCIEIPGQESLMIKQFCKIIEEIPKLGAKNEYLQEMSKIIFDKIVDLELPLWFIKELVANFKLALGHFSKEVLSKFIENKVPFLCKVADALDVCGDLSYQFLMLEMIFYICSPEQISEFSVQLFPESETLQNAFKSIRNDNFIAAVRKFLNLVNWRKDRVFSIKCKRAFLDGHSINAPQGCEESDLWVDFNKGSATVTMLCDANFSGSLLLNGKINSTDFWELVTINTTDVENVIISRWLEPGFPVSIGLVICFTLKEAVRAEWLKLMILNGSSLKRLEEHVLLDMFQEKVKGLSPPPSVAQPQEPKMSISNYNFNSMVLGAESLTSSKSPVYLEFKNRPTSNSSKELAYSYLLDLDESVVEIRDDGSDASTHLTGYVLDFIDLTVADDTPDLSLEDSVQRIQNDHKTNDAEYSEKYYSFPEINTVVDANNPKNESVQVAQPKDVGLTSEYFTALDVNCSSNSFSRQYECLQSITENTPLDKLIQMLNATESSAYLEENIYCSHGEENGLLGEQEVEISQSKNQVEVCKTNVRIYSSTTNEEPAEDQISLDQSLKQLDQNENLQTEVVQAREVANEEHESANPDITGAGHKMTENFSVATKSSVIQGSQQVSEQIGDLSDRSVVQDRKKRCENVFTKLPVDAKEETSAQEKEVVMVQLSPSHEMEKPVIGFEKDEFNKSVDNFMKVVCIKNFVEQKRHCPRITEISGTEVESSVDSVKKFTSQALPEKQSSSGHLQQQIISEILTEKKICKVPIQRANIGEYKQVEILEIDNSHNLSFALDADKAIPQKISDKLVEETDTIQTINKSKSATKIVVKEKCDLTAEGRSDVNTLKQFSGENSRCNLVNEKAIFPPAVYDVKKERIISHSRPQYRKRIHVEKKSGKPAKRQKRLSSHKLYDPTNLSYTKLFMEEDFNEKMSIYCKKALEDTETPTSQKYIQKKIVKKKVKPDSENLKKRLLEVEKKQYEEMDNNILGDTLPLQEEVGTESGINVKENQEKDVQTFEWKMKKKIRKSISRKKRKKQSEEDAFDKILTSQEKSKNQKLNCSRKTFINTPFSRNYTLPARTSDSFLSLVEALHKSSNVTFSSNMIKKNCRIENRPSKKPKLLPQKQKSSSSSLLPELRIEKEPVKTAVGLCRSTPKITVISNILIKEGLNNCDKKSKSLPALSETSAVTIPFEFIDTKNMENQSFCRNSMVGNQKNKIPVRCLSPIAELITSPLGLEVTNPSVMGFSGEGSQSSSTELAGAMLKKEEFLSWVQKGMSDEEVNAYKNFLEIFMRSFASMNKTLLFEVRGPISPKLIPLYNLMAQLDESFENYFKHN